MTENLPSALEVALNRLAGESVLASPGRDEGLIPAYSLLGELAEHCAGAPELRAPIGAVAAQIERLLDAAQPFDEPAHRALQALVEWLPRALDSRAAGRPLPVWNLTGAARSELAPTAPSPAEAGEAAADGLLELDLGESRELLQEFHCEASEHLLSIEAALLALEHRPGDPEAINSIFRSFHTIKGNAGFLGLVPMNRLAHEVETLLDLVRTDRLRVNGEIVTGILRSRDTLQALNQQVGEVLEHGREPDQIVPVGSLIETIRRLAAGSALPACAPDAAPRPQPAGEPASEPKPATPAKTANQTVRVSTDKLDTLMNVVGELVIVQSQLNETARQVGAAAPGLAGNVGLLSRLIKELQYNAMSLRMIADPAHLPEDGAAGPGSGARVREEGGLYDLGRGHGTRPGAWSRKSPIRWSTWCATRSTMAWRLPKSALLTASRKPVRSPCAPSIGAARSSSNCATMAGASTRRESSPRGEKAAGPRGRGRPSGARGDLQLFPGRELDGRQGHRRMAKAWAWMSSSATWRGSGTASRILRTRPRLRPFQVKLPLTMAIIDGLVVRVGDRGSSCPARPCRGSPAPGAAKTSSGWRGCGEVLDLRGRLTPLHRLDRHLGSLAGERALGRHVVIVEASGRMFALLVDEMISKQEVVIKSFGSYLQGSRGRLRRAILGDGSIALILDPGALLQAA